MNTVDSFNISAILPSLFGFIGVIIGGFLTYYSNMKLNEKKFNHKIKIKKFEKNFNILTKIHSNLQHINRKLRKLEVQLKEAQKQLVLTKNNDSITTLIYLDFLEKDLPLILEDIHNTAEKNLKLSYNLLDINLEPYEDFLNSCIIFRGSVEIKLKNVNLKSLQVSSPPIRALLEDCDTLIENVKQELCKIQI